MSCFLANAKLGRAGLEAPWPRRMPRLRRPRNLFDILRPCCYKRPRRGSSRGEQKPLPYGPRGNKKPLRMALADIKSLFVWPFPAVS